ncbi:RH6 [Ovine adenovirus 7]|uniref:RH6 n=1 Tax=Ovine adenovirus D serotype 7 (isolate OAV287) TaxID=114430 RepID=Q83916_ADEO7|nr:RH6 [Ovine adenovirus 7]AAB29329.2 RH6 [Ovine adenovirus 7]
MDLRSLLPDELWIEIFCYLTNKDIAKFVMCYNNMIELVKSSKFLCLYIKRFANIDCKLLQKFIVKSHLRFHAMLSVPSFWCDVLYYLPSGHCIACLTHPYLLLYSPFKCKCYCKDHRDLWQKYKSVILWSRKKYRRKFDAWPVCNAVVRKNSIKKCL